MYCGGGSPLGNGGGRERELGTEGVPSPPVCFLSLLPSLSSAREQTDPQISFVSSSSSPTPLLLHFPEKLEPHPSSLYFPLSKVHSVLLLPSRSLLLLLLLLGQHLLSLPPYFLFDPPPLTVLFCLRPKQAVSHRPPSLLATFARLF